MREMLKSTGRYMAFVKVCFDAVVQNGLLSKSLLCASTISTDPKRKLTIATAAGMLPFLASTTQ